MKRRINPLRTVVWIGDERTGPRGGHTRLCTLECGHLKAWSSTQPRFPRLRVKLVPKRMRCLLCAIGCVTAPFLEALDMRQLIGQP